MMMGRDPGADREPRILRFHDDPSDFVTQNMWCFLAKVPSHKLAAAQSAGFGLDQKATGWASWNGNIDDFQDVIDIK